MLLSGEHSLRKISATHPIVGKCDHIYIRARGRTVRLVGIQTPKIPSGEQM